MGPQLLQTEFEGLQEMQSLNAAFLNSGKGSDEVRNFLEKAHLDEELLLRFLIGRKYRARYAWETLKRYAEVRYDEYPELYPEKPPDTLRPLANQIGVAGVLKSRDKFGRRIGLFDIGAWNPDQFTTDEISIGISKVAEVAHVDEDVVVNGAIIIVQCKGLGARHAKEFSIRNIRRTIDVFLRAYPVKLKGIFFVNVPYFFSSIANVIKCFFPNKLRKRLIITSEDCQDCKELRSLVSFEQLPKCVGGSLEFFDAVEDLMPLFGDDPITKIG